MVRLSNSLQAILVSSAVKFSIALSILGLVFNQLLNIVQIITMAIWLSDTSPIGMMTGALLLQHFLLTDLNTLVKS